MAPGPHQSILSGLRALRESSDPGPPRDQTWELAYDEILDCGIHPEDAETAFNDGYKFYRAKYILWDGATPVWFQHKPGKYEAWLFDDEIIATNWADFQAQAWASINDDNGFSDYDPDEDE